MLQALFRTITEILDSKKAFYSFIATGLIVLLHVKFDVSVQNALLIVSPLGLVTVAQAHVDAKNGASSGKSNNTVSTDSASAAAPPANNSQV